MRTWSTLLLTLLVAAGPASAAFGAAPLDFRTYEGPGTASEPTIGIPWSTDSVFYHAGSTTYRLQFDADDEAEWEDVTPPYQVPVNVDPMLIADPDTGRVWAGGLHGPCSIMMHSDDDGETWLPAGNMCSGADFDHQSIGSGPSNSPQAGLLYPHAQYYCGQLGTISCATSYDGGQTWSPFVQEQTVCEGFHGHIRVSRPSGMMAVPVADCGGDLGMLTTVDGVTYTAKTVPDSETWVGGFDPSLQFGRGEGWLWYGHASENGIHISRSTDDGASWDPLGGGMGVDETHFLDVGAFHDPPVLSGTFADVQVGDDDRVAFSFIGLEATGDPDVDAALQTTDIYSCYDQGETDAGRDTPMDLNQSDMQWHYYVAFTYDGGDTWAVERISDDPVQVGGVYDSVTDSSSGCRNLLDFNDMDIDSQGRVHIAFADGCIGECAQTREPGTDGYRAQGTALYRQTGGQGLFAEFDSEDPGVGGDPTGPGGEEPTGEAPERGTPFVGIAAASVLLAAIAVAARRRDGPRR